MKFTARTSDADEGLKPAAIYVRMSTEHQQYSTSNQRDVIEEYARKRGMCIVREYSDDGKSGLNIAGRDSFSQLIDDVRSGSAPFDYVLVYDVSRWGRFQDTDESAYYEFICRQAGIEVHFCAEQFENDGSPVSTIVKGLKRAMAGEYNRELSVKVFQGACRLIGLGFRQGGPAGYGLRRMLVDHTGQSKGVLSPGEQKSIQTDRVVLVPGPDNEVADVRWIFHVFINEGLSEAEIAKLLNCRGLKTDFGREWSRGTVHQVLTNEKYIGNNVYHRTSFKLKKDRVRNDPADWIRADGAWPAIIEPEVFHRAQGIILERSRRFTNEEMLERLKSLLALHGRLSGILIDEREDLPSSSAFRHRFGSLVSAYSLIGYTPSVDYSFIEDNRAIRKMHPEIVSSVIADLEARSATVRIDPRTDLLKINDEFTVSIVLCRHTVTSKGTSRWAIRFDSSLLPDITIAIRLEAGNRAIRDYYLLPSLDMTWQHLRMHETNGVELDGYQFDDLSFLFHMAERILIQDPV
ncbi:MAG: recombinase family protein [Luteolibacter sp.]